MNLKNVNHLKQLDDLLAEFRLTMPGIGIGTDEFTICDDGVLALHEIKSNESLVLLTSAETWNILVTKELFSIGDYGPCIKYKDICIVTVIGPFQEMYDDIANVNVCDYHFQSFQSLLEWSRDLGESKDIVEIARCISRYTTEVIYGNHDHFEWL